VTTDRPFTHPNFGSQARVELEGREVRLVFVAGSAEYAEHFAEDLVKQLRNGALNITLMGTPTHE
jgi:hypothetical protein